MAVIKIDRFGGILPSVDARNLPDTSAQTAHNLDLRFGDFRPVKSIGDSVATAVAGAKSIFRTPAGTWLSSTNDVNYVNTPIHDSTLTTERVYMTGRSAYPEAWQSGSTTPASDGYRRLGVPVPPDFSSVTTNTVDEFTPGDWGSAAAVAVDEVTALVQANLSETTIGGANPAALTNGIWLAHGATTGLPSANANQVNFAVPATGSAASPTITNAADSYLLDASLGGKFVTYNGSTYWAIPFTWRANVFALDEAGLQADLLTVMKPPENTEQLFDTATANSLGSAFAARYDPAQQPTAYYVERMTTLQLLIIAQLTKEDTSLARAAELSILRGRLGAEVSSAEKHYANENADLKESVAARLRPYSALLPVAVTVVESTRAYIYTYVTDWGEESAPSDPSELVTLDQNDTCTVTIPASTVAAPYGPITSWRLYRSSSSSTTAAYQFVGEYPIATLSVTDTKLQEELEEPCPTLTWVEPPENLRGLVALPNGILAGFFGKTVCFSEPYHPYAWPVEYQQTVGYNVVGLGVFGQTLVCLTEGKPSYFSGADSASMSEQKMESPQACISKRSIASSEGGVFFASPDGICLADHSGINLLTLGAYNKDDWQALGVTNSFATFAEGMYYIFTGD